MRSATSLRNRVPKLSLGTSAKARKTLISDFRTHAESVDLVLPLATKLRSVARQSAKLRFAIVLTVPLPIAKTEFRAFVRDQLELVTSRNGLIPVVMRRLISQCATNIQLWLFRRNEVARFDGIILTDIEQRSNRPPHFRDTLLSRRCVCLRIQISAASTECASV